MPKTTATRCQRAIALPFIAVALLHCHCLIPPGADYTDGTLDTAPPIDWAAMDTLVTMAFDVTDKNTTDEQLRAKYTTGTLTPTVRRLEITGDRYLLLIDANDQRQTIILAGTNLDDNADVSADEDVNLVTDQTLNQQFDEGFLDDAHDVHDDVLPLLVPNYATQVVGYSLGGAVAAILTAYLHLDGFTLETTVTFGQPRVTDEAGASVLAGLDILRFRAHGGLVPELPPSPYRHFGDEVILLEGTEFVYLTPTDANYDASPVDLQSKLDDALGLAVHGSYPERIKSKLNGAAQVPYPSN